MNGQPTELVETADEVGQAKQIVDLVKENKLMTALVVFVLWQTGTLMDLYLQTGGAICG
tara:strand:+ start:337 stop:513 length:177 start_codon:yes stop_codon:yes gene_type:complete